MLAERYLLLRLLGKGGFSEVFQASHPIPCDAHAAHDPKVMMMMMPPHTLLSPVDLSDAIPTLPLTYVHAPEACLTSYVRLRVEGLLSPCQGFCCRHMI